MRQINLTEAARLAGISRATLNRHIRSGHVIKSIDAAGKPFIGADELERVYGVLAPEDGASRVHLDERDGDAVHTPAHEGVAQADETVHTQASEATIRDNNEVSAAEIEARILREQLARLD